MSTMMWEETDFMAFAPHKKIILLVANQEFNYTLGGLLIIKNSAFCD